MPIKRLMLICTLLAALATVSHAIDSVSSPDAPALTVRVQNPQGQFIGTVTLRQAHSYVLVTARLRGLTPGFHGFHIHEFGRCEVTDAGAFLSAGGHYDPSGAAHPDHAGDMPMLLVLQNGSAYLSFTTDRFEMAALQDRDGSAVIIHAGADNYANIPERYGGPDETTLAAGDAGSRVGCGVISPAG